MATVRHSAADATVLRSRWLAQLNGPWHERAMQAFLVVVLAHWAEHIAQGVQVWVLHWPLAESRGILGLAWPWLVTSEWLHYGYAVVMLAALWALRPGMTGKARFWWSVALWVQTWHHLEHFLLLAQAVTGTFLFDASAPTSILQVLAGRVELHLFYNSIVFAPMVMGMLHHLFPSEEDACGTTCACAIRAVNATPREAPDPRA